MLTRVEIENYRPLAQVSQSLQGLCILVGPNASGKTAFLDALSFVRDLLTEGLETAVLSRAPGQDLVFFGSVPKGGKTQNTNGFGIALELSIPQELRRKLPNQYSLCRYEVFINPAHVPEFVSENLWLLQGPSSSKRLERLGLMDPPLPISLETPPLSPRWVVTPQARKGWRRIVSKTAGGNDYFRSETTGWNAPFRLGVHKSVLANLPEEEDRFPVATWCKRLLIEGIRPLLLDTSSMRLPRPAMPSPTLEADGSNLASVVGWLYHNDRPRFDQWLNHVRTIIPELATVKAGGGVERLTYLMAKEASGVQTPGWLMSDGTLRLLAHTIVAYLPTSERIYLIEEPENGIHPRAIEAVYDSLSSVYDGQVLVATHSPVLLSVADPAEVLCFSKDKDGATHIVRGDKHPALKDWHGEPNLSVLYAAGILG